MYITDDPVLATDIFVAGTPKEAKAFQKFHGAMYRSPIYFLITGHVPDKTHAEFIRQFLPKKIHFIFSKDDTGALCDLKLAAWIRNKSLKITYHNYHYHILFEQKNYSIVKLSLNALEKQSGYNFRIRTHKPRKTTTYHEQFRRKHPT